MIKLRKRKQNNRRQDTSASAAAITSTLPAQRSFSQVFTQALTSFTISAYNTIANNNLTFQPSTSMRNQFDKFVVDEILVTFYFLPAQGSVANSSSSVMLAPIGMCWDPTGDDTGLLASSQTNIINYHNSRRVCLTSGAPEFRYKIHKPVNYITGPSSAYKVPGRDPIPTDFTWNAGQMYFCSLYPSTLSALVGTGYSIGYNVQYKVTYSGPRAL